MPQYKCLGILITISIVTEVPFIKRLGNTKWHILFGVCVRTEMVFVRRENLWQGSQPRSRKWTAF